MWENDPRTKICCDFKAGKITAEPSHGTAKPTTPLITTTIATGIF